MDEVAAPPQAEGNGKSRKSTRGGKLTDEIRIVRDMIRRVESMANDGQEQPDVLKTLDAVSLACSRLATMLRAERALEENQSGTDYIKAALDEIREDMKRNGIDSVLTSGL